MITLLTEKNKQNWYIIKIKYIYLRKFFALILSFFGDGAVLYDVQF